MRLKERGKCAKWGEKQELKVLIIEEEGLEFCIGRRSFDGKYGDEKVIGSLLISTLLITTLFTPKIVLKPLKNY